MDASGATSVNGPLKFNALVKPELMLIVPLN